jgi:very-short-patch-repair endonuclease
MGMQGLTLLKDPIADNFRQFLYMQALRLGEVIEKKTQSEANGGESTYSKEVGLQKAAKSKPSATSDGRTFDLGYASVDPFDRKESAVERVAAAAAAADGSMSPYRYEPLDVVAAMRAIRLNGMLVPAWLITDYNEIENNHPTNPTVQQSRADKLVAQKYSLLRPNEKMVSNAILDGFRLDMDFPDIKLNIELDGPSHKYPARRRYDRERDEYLTIKKGYQVSRIELTGKSPEDIAAIIDKTVTDRKVVYEEILDKQAQLLYARDSEIQKLYKKK